MVIEEMKEGQFDGSREMFDLTMGLDGTDDIYAEEENVLEMADDDGFFRFDERQKNSLLLLQPEVEQERSEKEKEEQDQLLI